MLRLNSALLREVKQKNNLRLPFLVQEVKLSLVPKLRQTSSMMTSLFILACTLREDPVLDTALELSLTLARHLTDLKPT